MLWAGVQKAWSYLHANYSEFALATYLPFTALLIAYGFGNLFIMYLEFKDVEWLRKYKIQKGRYVDKPTIIRLTKDLLFSYFCIMLPLNACAFPLFKWLGFDMGPVLPSWQTVLFHLFVCLLAEDFSHFWLHWILHTPYLYRKIHKVHHEFYYPISLAASYAHPLEVLILGLATFSGALIVRPHYLTFIFWVILRQSLAVETHCGYDFPISPNHWFPFAGGAEFHDFHHKTINGNYASNFVFWDWLFGTDKAFRQFKKKAALKAAKTQ